MNKKSPATAKREFAIPHTYVILFSIIIIATIATYVVTPGIYERAKDDRTGRTLVDPASYHHVEPTPVSPFNIFKTIPKSIAS